MLGMTCTAGVYGALLLLLLREAEVVRLHDQLKQREEEWAKQLMQMRQTALDESVHRSSTQEVALQKAANERRQLQQQIDSTSSALTLKESELESAHKQLGSALESNQQLAAQHAKVTNCPAASSEEDQEKGKKITDTSSHRWQQQPE
jgi:hypothetical protein